MKSYFLFGLLHLLIANTITASSSSTALVVRELSEDEENYICPADEPPYTYFQLVWGSEEDGKEWCLQPETGDGLVIRPCGPNQISQLWTYDCNSSLRNKRNYKKCLIKIGNEVFYKRCDDPSLPGNTFVSFSQFHIMMGKLAIMMPIKWVKGKWTGIYSEAELQNVFKSGGKSNTQKWIRRYQTTPITFVGESWKRFSTSGSCDECSGACDDDDDCAGSLRCAKRVSSDGRELVPGCSFEPNNTYYRFSKENFCFQPIRKLAGYTVNYIGECKTGQCGRCEGGCLNDNDCYGNLKCYKRRGFAKVPGCNRHGGTRDMYDKNICYNPNKLPNVTIKNCRKNGGFCKECQGDCQNDSDCETGLRCAIREKNQEVPGCSFSGTGSFPKKNICFDPTNYPHEPSTILYVGECGGENNYKCQRCQGNCNSDLDCAEGLTCLERSGFKAVPGCNGQGADLDFFGQNICYDNSESTTLRWITSDCRYRTCRECDGNCHEDDDCKGRLRCAIREGYEDVPGCKWGENSNPRGWERGPNYCFDPLFWQNDVVNYVGECGPNTYRCRECEGACLVDADCKDGLECMERQGFEAVLGCVNEGGKLDMFAKRICYNPLWSFAPSMSQSPSESPSLSFPPSMTPTDAPTTSSPTFFPSSASNSPSGDPSNSPSGNASDSQSGNPSYSPSENPSNSQSENPSNRPTIFI